MAIEPKPTTAWNHTPHIPNLASPAWRCQLSFSGCPLFSRAPFGATVSFLLMVLLLRLTAPPALLQTTPSPPHPAWPSSLTVRCFSWMDGRTDSKIVRGDT